MPLEVKTVADTPDPQVNEPDETPQLPLDDFNVKPLPDGVAVMVAHVPDVYHVPLEMMQPFWLPPAITFK